MRASAISVGRKGDEGGVTEHGECPAHSQIINSDTHTLLTIHCKTVYSTSVQILKPKSGIVTVGGQYYNKSSICMLTIICY